MESLQKVYSKQDMYSSEKPWTADLGLILDWNNTHRGLQS